MDTALFWLATIEPPKSTVSLSLLANAPGPFMGSPSRFFELKLRVQHTSMPPQLDSEATGDS